MSGIKQYKLPLTVNKGRRKRAAPNCELAENVTLSEGVRFTDNATINATILEVDLTTALSTEDGIDITTDIITDGPSLLNQINDLPDMQANRLGISPKPRHPRIGSDG